MYMFEDDTTVIPKETSWFEEVNGTESTPLRARKMYSEDWLGLRALDRKGGLKFRITPGDHMQLEEILLGEAFAEFYGPLNLRPRRSEPRPGSGGGDDL
jgi:palmitoyl-protein thioesterase